MSKILLSNATTAKGRGMLTYGIPLAIRLVQEFQLAGLELLLGWLPTMKAWKRLPSGLDVAVHLPWSWDFAPWGWNPDASFSANLVGKVSYLTQNRMPAALEIAEKLGAKYKVIHPGAVVGTPISALKAIAELAFENDWNPPGYKGVEAALRFSDLAGAKIVLDTCHLARVVEDADCARKAVRSVKDRLIAVHVSDYDAERGEHLIPRWGNEGFKALPAIIDDIRAESQEIFLVVECKEGDPYEATEGGVSYLRR